MNSLWAISSCGVLFQPKYFQLKESYGLNSSWNVLPDMQHYSPPFSSRSNLNGAWKPSIKNRPNGNLSSSFDSDNIQISMFPLICSQRKLKLFLKESIFCFPNINLLILLPRIILKSAYSIWNNCSWSISDIFHFNIRIP